MTIEVRQMVIRSTVGVERTRPEPRRTELGPEELARLKEEILAECRRWMAERLREREER